ncbi:TlpA family protein disulfide reductase [Sphingobacterium paucimobilis]|uniref:Alkyl hydroperoxide reductase subunit C/ Thiol specific antioxidant domain-containing protein n=1 Tax=Sphingobacterium paucimobilis HER1398 TaxID=1346330 RepID=U2HQX5_9SPHI|nr:redoxin domain-containing protein [Sphingobacterium paucimobilis]ERJ57685.1 hypothetical protein M472_02790 [Sphingobacterium paucimobilis HER1398]
MSDKIKQNSNCALLIYRPSDESGQILPCGRNDITGKWWTLLAKNQKLSALSIIFCVLFSSLAFTQVVAQTQSRSVLQGEIRSAADGHNTIDSNIVQPLALGMKVPEEFWTTNHLFYNNGDTVRTNLEQYRNKLLVLDFWATWCAICIGQMEKNDKLFAQFQEEANILLVNPRVTRDTYEKIKTQEPSILEASKMSALQSIIDDTLIQQLFPHKIYPRYVWISHGRFLAHTLAPSVSAGHVADMLNILSQGNHEK